MMFSEKKSDKNVCKSFFTGRMFLLVTCFFSAVILCSAVGIMIISSNYSHLICGPNDDDADRSISSILSTNVAGSTDKLCEADVPDMPNDLRVDGATLNLKGVGLRQARKFGLTVDVYIAAFYTNDSSFDPYQLINSDSYKQIDMYFVRDVDKDSLRDSWEWKRGLEEQGISDVEQMHKTSGLDTVFMDIKKGQKVSLQLVGNKMNFLVDGDLKFSYIDKAFVKAVLGVYFLTPPDDNLPEALLSGAPADC